MNDLTPPPKLSIAYSSTAELSVELAKMLALVAPISMTTEQQELFLRAAVDALQDIRVDEVVAVSAEVRRSVTRAAQIVPEIARLIAERRARNTDKTTMWVEPETVRLQPPPAPPLTERELAALPAHVRKMGLNSGFLEYRGGQLVERAL